VDQRRRRRVKANRGCGRGPGIAAAAFNETHAAHSSAVATLLRTRTHSASTRLTAVCYPFAHFFYLFIWYYFFPTMCRCLQGLNFFDTAERYGASPLEVAFGLGWGAGETQLGEYLRTSEGGAGGVVASKCVPRHVSLSLMFFVCLGGRRVLLALFLLKFKLLLLFSALSAPIIPHPFNFHTRVHALTISPVRFTPSPWRTSAASVVAACAQSCQRLGVKQLDLYQIHMPDVVQPLARLGYRLPCSLPLVCLALVTLKT
jgi:hypothetical protein